MALKGFYDGYSERAHILVTGSARLDVYKKGGESLMGRYFLYRFHPLSIAEVGRPTLSTDTLYAAPVAISEGQFDALWQFGGYPDPFLKANERFFNWWISLRLQQLFQEDIRNLTRIQELQQLEVLAKLLQLQVGQQTNYDSLSKKVRVSDKTIRSWLNTLNCLYHCFDVRPLSKSI